MLEKAGCNFKSCKGVGDSEKVSGDWSMTHKVRQRELDLLIL